MPILLRVDRALQLLAEPMDTCERCGGYAKHQVLVSVHKIRLFFVPINLVGSTIYLDRCTRCSRVNMLPKAQAESVLAHSLT